jgi:hypothetical protein
VWCDNVLERRSDELELAGKTLLYKATREVRCHWSLKAIRRLEDYERSGDFVLKERCCVIYPTPPTVLTQTQQCYLYAFHRRVKDNTNSYSITGA